METRVVGKLSVNKRMVRDFYETAFNLHKPREAAEKHLGKVYRQHNPMVGDGPEAFVNFVAAYAQANPQLHIDIKRIIAEGDLVVTHSHLTLYAQDRGMAVADIFRVENGKIVEHLGCESGGSS
jgi:predicted SnoaL-like aldol condensation-catalyzing enzyme